MSIIRRFLSLLKRKEKRKEIKREDLSPTHVKIYERVSYTPGWLTIVAIPHYVLTFLLIIGALVFGVSNTPVWFNHLLEITIYFWLASALLIMGSEDKRKIESHTEWRKDAYPPTEMGV